ncbi:MAG: family 43 glycosylhydrolase [Sphingomonas sp.]
MRAALAALTLGLLCAAAPVPGPAPHNPVIVGADPHLAVVGHEWWIYPTGPGDRLYGYHSPDLQHWQRTSAPLLAMSDIGWIKDDGAPSHALWAPALAEANGRFYLYYAVGPQNPTPSRIGVAVADRPEGPFKDIGQPLVTGGNGFEAIDPMVFVDPRSHVPYLYAGGSAGATLRIYQLAPDMVHVVRRVETTQPPHFTEGVFMAFRDGTYYLSYSHGRWNDASYSVHYATASSPTGPWTYRGVILKSDATHKGPGHHAMAENPATGAWYIAYHRWDGEQGNGPYKGERKIAIQRLLFRNGRILPLRMTDDPPPAAPITTRR